MFIYAVATVAFIHIPTLRGLMEVNSKHCRISFDYSAAQLSGSFFHPSTHRWISGSFGLHMLGVVLSWHQGKGGWNWMSTPGWSLLGLDHLISHMSMFVKEQQDKDHRFGWHLQITESNKNPWLPWEILGNCPHGWEIRMAGTAKHLLNGYQEGMSRGDVRSCGLHLQKSKTCSMDPKKGLNMIKQSHKGWTNISISNLCLMRIRP